MPSPSHGCQTCKLRRIKCDEIKPTCQRCTKSKRLCISRTSAKQANFSIHLENPYASGLSKRPRGPRSSLTIPAPLHLDLQARALAYYLQFHLQSLIDVPKISGGLAECVSEWKREGRECQMVDLALSSMALGIFARTQRHPPAAKEAEGSYGRLLRVARQRIAVLAERPTADDGDIDACLLAVSLMGQYEGTAHRPSPQDSVGLCKNPQSWSHHDGALAILKLWYDNPNHGSGTFIIKHTRMWLMNSCLLRTLPLPDWLQDGEKFGEDDDELSYDRIIVRIIDMHYESAMISLNSCAGFQKAMKLNIEAQELDEALRDWTDRVPVTCSPHHHFLAVLPRPDSKSRKHFYSQSVYSYPKPGNAAAWSQNFAMRMVIHSTRLKLLSILPERLVSCHSQQREECISQLHNAADSFAGSIPFCLERFTISPSSGKEVTIKLNVNDEIKPCLASMMAWPLTIASRIESFDEKQRMWFGEELMRLGIITGADVNESGDG